MNGVEQITVESGEEEDDSSLQRIASGMLKVESTSVSMQEVIHTNFKEVGDRSVSGDFEDLWNFQELCARQYMAPGNFVNLMEFYVKQS